MSPQIGDQAPAFSMPTDGGGVIRGVWRKVKVKGHVEEVLAALQAL